MQTFDLDMIIDSAPVREPSSSPSPTVTNTGTLANSRTGRGRSRYNKILYPEFNSLVHYTTDPYWIAFFSDAVYGKFPSGVSYRGSKLMVSKKGKWETLDCTAHFNDPITLIQNISAFLRNKIGIVSEQDRRRETIIIDQLREQNAQVRVASNRNQRRLVTEAIDMYIARISQERRLSAKEVDDLRQSVNLGQLLGIFNDDDLIWDADQIVDIRGLIVGSESKFTADRIAQIRRISTAIYPEERFLQTDVVANNYQSVDFLKLWTKWLKKLKQLPMQPDYEIIELVI